MTRRSEASIQEFQGNGWRRGGRICWLSPQRGGGIGKVSIATGQLSILQTEYAYLRLILKGVMCIVDLSWTTNEYPFQCDCAPQRRNWLLVLRPSVSQSTYKIEISVGGYSFRLLHHLMCKFRNCCWIDQSLHSQYIL